MKTIEIHDGHRYEDYYVRRLIQKQLLEDKIEVKFVLYNDDRGPPYIYEMSDIKDNLAPKIVESINKLHYFCAKVIDL